MQRKNENASSGSASIRQHSDQMSLHVPNQRIDYTKVAPEAYNRIAAVQSYVDHKKDLPKSLLELVRTRSSQINGCAYCLDMH